MGGRVLDYPAKTILKEGIEQGIKQGIEQGIELGRKEAFEEARADTVKGIIFVCKKLNGVKLDAIESVMAQMDLSQKDAEALVSKYW